MAQGRGHINTYRDREYFRKELSGNEISQGIKQIGSSLVNNFNEAVTVTQKANESTLASNQVDLSAKFLAENNKINTKYQADPANPQREVEARQAFDLLASRYKVNPLCEKQWNDIKTNVYDKYKTYNAQWVEQQQQTNIQTNLKNGYENLINQISMLGESGASVDQMKLIYANGIEGLKNGATAGLGEVVVENFLKDADHDIMTTYISALALNNPIAANKLIQREDVRNDIGRAETLEKLESYIGTSLNNQAKRTAVNELCSALRAMNSDEAEDLYTGKADLAKAMKFIENNKQLPKGSVDAINELYGIKTKSGDWYYDSETKSYKKEEKKTKGGVKGMDAIDAATAIELKLIDLFSFNDEDMQEVNPKKTVKKGEAQNVQSKVLNRLQTIAGAQGDLDRAYSEGIIDKSTRKRLMDSYIQPMTDYLEANLENLDESRFSPKLGYDQIKKKFDVEKAGNQKNKVRKNLLTAQGYYYSQLDNARQKLGLQSIYDLEKLPSGEQKKIYKQASDNAITMAQKYGEHPEVFFRQQYPQLYLQGVNLFGEKDGEEVAKNAAKNFYNAPDNKPITPEDAMSNALVQMNSFKKMQAKNLIDTMIAANKQYGDGRVLSDMEIENRANNLGLTMDQLTNDALSKRVSPQLYLIYLESLKRKNK